ncbi:MAG: FHA domain-containing protein [Hyphomicrobium sp.]
MRQQHVARHDVARTQNQQVLTVFVVALGVSSGSPAIASTAQEGRMGDRIAELLAHGIDVAGWSIAAGYRAAPALMLGLATLLAVPAISLASRLVCALNRRSLLARIESESSAHNGDDALPSLPGHAFVELMNSEEGATRSASCARYAILHDMLRIGREEDNDVRLTEAAVHRYHAAILREDFGSYRITDLSGIEGNGVRVNGQPCEDVRLRDGDLIELGPGRLRFHAGLV